MRKFKMWLFRRFLPEWCREELLQDNRKLSLDCAAAQRKIEQLQAYIRGMQSVLRAGRKIVIQNRGESDGHFIGADKQQ